MNSTVVAWLTGIGAVLFAFAGVALVIRETRRKEREDAMYIIERLEHITLMQQNEAIAWRSYVYTLRVLCADKGIATPEPPPLVDVDAPNGSMLPSVRNARRGNGWFRRRRRRNERQGSDPVNDDTVEFHVTTSDDRWTDG
jgi:hypothetical protein